MSVRVLGIAAGYRKLGMAYLDDGKLMDWRLSIKATYSFKLAFAQAARWIAYYGPSVVVIEDTARSKKGSYTKSLLLAVESAANNANVVVSLVSPPPRRSSKYADAARLAQAFPELHAWVPPPRRDWETEPRNTVLFEALGLASTWWDQSRPAPDTS